MKGLTLNLIFFALILIFTKTTQQFFRSTPIIIQINAQLNEFAI